MTTTTNLTRRTALAGAAAGTLIPVAGLAQGAEPDPILALYAEWRELDRDVSRVQDEYSRIEREIGVGTKEAHAFYDGPLAEAHGRAIAVERRIGSMVPVSIAGLAAQLRVLVEANGYRDKCMEGDPETQCVLNTLAGAERLAGRAA